MFERNSLYSAGCFLSQPTIFFTHTKPAPATSQPAIIFSHNKLVVLRFTMYGIGMTDLSIEKPDSCCALEYCSLLLLAAALWRSWCSLSQIPRTLSLPSSKAFRTLATNQLTLHCRPEYLTGVAAVVTMADDQT